MFAPIALIMKYQKVEEAIELANGTRYGLGASVFGPDQEQCLKVANRLECGMVSINDFAVYYVSTCLPSSCICTHYICCAAQVGASAITSEVTTNSLTPYTARTYRSAVSK